MKDIKNFLESKGAVIHDKHLEEDDEDEDTVTEDHNRQGMYSVISIKCTVRLAVQGSHFETILYA